MKKFLFVSVLLVPSVAGAITYSTPISTFAVISATQTWTGQNTYKTRIILQAPLRDNNGTDGTSGQSLVSNGPNVPPTWQTTSSGTMSGNVNLSVGTGTASNYTTQVTSPTNVESFLGSQFISLASGVTNFLSLNPSSVTLYGQSVPLGTGTAGNYVQSVQTNAPLSGGSAGSVGANLTLSISTVGFIPSSTNYIDNQNFLQSGATFYTSSGSVQGVFSVIQPDNDTSSAPIHMRTLTTQEGAANMYHSLFLNGVIPAPAFYGGEFIITVSSVDLTSSVGSITDRLQRPEIAMAPGNNQGGGPGNTQFIALRAQGEQIPESNPYGDFVDLVGTNTSYNPLALNYDAANQNVCTDSNKILRTSGCPSTGGGSSSLAVGTGTAANFTNSVTSPTVVISLLGAQFLDTTSGSTNFIALNPSSVTLLGQSIPAPDIAAGSLGPSVLASSIAVVNSGSNQCGSSTISPTVMFNAQGQIISCSSNTISSGGSSFVLAVGTGTTSNFTTSITSPTNIISLNGAQFLDTTSGTTNFIALNPSSVTLLGESIPAPDIAAGALGPSVLASSLTAVVVAGTIGSPTIVPTITYNAQGQIIAASSNTIASNGISTVAAGAGITVTGSTGPVATVSINFGSTNTWSAAQTFTETVTVSPQLVVTSPNVLPSQINNGLVVLGTFTIVYSTFEINGSTYNWQAGAGGTGQFLQNSNGIISSVNPTAETVISSVVTTATNLPATTTWGDIASVSLTAGTWIVSVQECEQAAGATLTSGGFIAVSTTSGNNAGGFTYPDTEIQLPLAATTDGCGTISQAVFVLSANKTLYAKMEDAYTLGQPTMKGRINAVQN